MSEGISEEAQKTLDQSSKVNSVDSQPIGADRVGNVDFSMEKQREEFQRKQTDSFEAVKAERDNPTTEADRVKSFWDKQQDKRDEQRDDYNSKFNKETEQG